MVFCISRTECFEICLFLGLPIDWMLGRSAPSYIWLSYQCRYFPFTLDEHGTREIPTGVQARDRSVRDEKDSDRGLWTQFVEGGRERETVMRKKRSLHCMPLPQNCLSFLPNWVHILRSLARRAVWCLWDVRMERYRFTRFIPIVVWYGLQVVKPLSDGKMRAEICCTSICALFGAGR